MAAIAFSLLLHGVIFLWVGSFFPCRPPQLREAGQVIEACIVSASVPPAGSGLKPCPAPSRPSVVCPSAVLPTPAKEPAGIVSAHPSVPAALPIAPEREGFLPSLPPSVRQGDGPLAASPAASPAGAVRGNGARFRHDGSTGEEPREVGMGDPEAPRFLRRAEPLYPPVARRLGREGEVVLRLFLDERGVLDTVEVVRGSGFGFTEAAIDAMRRSVFAPARRNGNPVASRVVVPVRFLLRED